LGCDASRRLAATAAADFNRGKAKLMAPGSKQEKIPATLIPGDGIGPEIVRSAVSAARHRLRILPLASFGDWGRNSN
jgi:hypothetical protein